uniref:Putative glutamate-gated chloride channel alpha subunit n=1 Tax=Haemonchus contortus TaxID=6289 RepID=Q9TZR3_HAECO|nr:putative glutamate-gated chloride channel alpha subunit [Haemonchus contortus]
MFALILPFLLHFTRSEGFGYEKLLDEQKIIKHLLESPYSDYDWRVRPRGRLGPADDDDYDSEPVFITVNMYLRSISKVDDVNMEYSLHFTFREEWIDERLYFNSPTLKHIVLSPGQRIWVPDTFFQNEKDGKKHDIDTPNILIRIHNGTGKILYSCRLTLTLSCPMRLADYPLDVQTCVVDFASYAYTTKDIEYGWKEEKPIQIKDGLRQSLPSFLLSNVKTSNCTSVTNTGAYSCLRTIIELKREFSYYLLQLYIPSFMLVAVSWVSFWLDKDSVPARVTLGVTTLLTMTTQASGVNANLPPVSYTKAIDIWIGVCLAFIFGALLEFALVNWAARQDLVAHSRARYRQSPLFFRNPDSRQENSHHFYAPIQQEVTLEDLPFSWWDKIWKIRYKERSRRIDLISRVMFPLCFIIFNIMYWWRYLIPYMAVQAQLE